MEFEKCVHKFGLKPQEKGTLGTLDVAQGHIKNDLREVGCDVLNWIQLIQNRVRAHVF